MCVESPIFMLIVDKMNDFRRGRRLPAACLENGGQSATPPVLSSVFVVVAVGVRSAFCCWVFARRTRPDPWVLVSWLCLLPVTTMMMLLQKRALSGPGSAEKDKKQKKAIGRYVILQSFLGSLVRSQDGSVHIIRSTYTLSGRYIGDNRGDVSRQRSALFVTWRLRVECHRASFFWLLCYTVSCTIAFGWCRPSEK